MTLTPERREYLEALLDLAHKTGNSAVSLRTEDAIALGWNPPRDYDQPYTFVTRRALAAALFQPTVFHQDPGADPKHDAAHHGQNQENQP